MKRMSKAPAAQLAEQKRREFREMNPQHPYNSPPSDSKRLLIRIACIALAVVVLLLLLYQVGRNLETGGKVEEPRGSLEGRFEELPVIQYNGKSYQFREKLTSILLLGVDTWSDREVAKDDYRNGGQSDFLLLTVIDHEQKTITPLQIDRDTMTEITILGILGNVSGTRNMQICLSHGFGNGGAQSSGFTVDAVSKLLLGVPVDFYVTMQLDGISTLNDALGGVTVTLEDDFTSLDPAMTPGTTLTLQGKQAEYFARYRMSIGVGTNESRMVRQQVYIQKATELFDADLQKNANFVGHLFDTLEPYLETSMKRARMINETWSTRQYERVPTIQLQGEHTHGKTGFVEFHPDAEALTETVLELFYKEI